MIVILFGSDSPHTILSRILYLTLIVSIRPSKSLFTFALLTCIFYILYPMDKAVASNSQGSGDLPNPSHSSVDRPKVKKPRKSKSSIDGSPAKALTAARDPSTGEFVSPSLAISFR